ncbi:MAG: DUF3341 domain-containing protein [Deltaproteobacteria bacterium]|nr:DUF3341 domain-containing protein [Deltaproteobacteria bacterium]
MTTPNTESSERVVGTVGLFDDVNDLMSAAAAVRDAGYSRWDCHTPYPVHGLDGAMALRPSKLSRVALTFGGIGFLCAIALQVGVGSYQYPTNIGGKPFIPWPALVPIMFEVFVLFSALAAVGSLFWMGRLGRWHSPLHDSDVARLVSSDRFAVVLHADDPSYDEARARELLERSGCEDVRPLVERQDDEPLL